jgi:mono/diheme cytochrome c family protein
VETSRLLILILPIAVCTLLLAAIAVSAQTPPSDAILASNPVFHKNCAKCHGKTAEGRHFRGPSLVSEKTTSVSAADLRNTIANGKGHMPKFAGRLTAVEIDTLVQQIKACKSKP